MSLLLRDQNPMIGFALLRHTFHGFNMNTTLLKIKFLFIFFFPFLSKT